MSHISITHCVTSFNPFDAIDADVVLRTTDGEDLRVYRRILQESSPFFSDLFSLPQPQSEIKADTPVIDVDEQAVLMKTLLLLVYPGEEPIIGTLIELSALVAVAMKYQMVRAVATLRRLLISPRFVENHPTQVYAIACRHDFEEEARIASKYTLNINILDCPLSDDLKYITAFSYHRLLDLHRKRGDAARVLLVCEDDVKCMQCSASHYGGLCPPRWWTNFEQRAKEELRMRPSTDIIFSLEFLAQSSNTGCQRCAGSILESHAFLMRLKDRIDALPATI